jgi:hypothetical protein
MSPTSSITERSLFAPRPILRLHGIGFHRLRLSMTVATSYTFPVRCFRLFSCFCEKYTGEFVVCQVLESIKFYPFACEACIAC